MIAFAAFLISCKKQNVAPTQYAGTWEYRGFIGYGIHDQQPAGNGKIIVLTKSNRFERWEQGTRIFKGIFFLTEKKDCSGERRDFIATSDKSFTNGYAISGSGDSLFISTPNCYADGGSAIYVKSDFNDFVPQQEIK